MKAISQSLSHNFLHFQHSCNPVTLRFTHQMTKKSVCLLSRTKYEPTDWIDVTCLNDASFIAFPMFVDLHLTSIKRVPVSSVEGKGVFVGHTLQKLLFFFIYYSTCSCFYPIRAYCRIRRRHGGISAPGSVFCSPRRLVPCPGKVLIVTQEPEDSGMESGFNSEMSSLTSSNYVHTHRGTRR